MSEPPEVCEPILSQTFGFHPLGVDDALRETHVPKVDDWGQYLVLQGIDFDKQNGRDLKMLELDVFLGSNHIVTYHAQPIPAVDHTWTSCQRDERYLKTGPPAFLLTIVAMILAPVGMYLWMRQRGWM